MLRELKVGVGGLIVAIASLTVSPSSAQTPTVENGEGTVRAFGNLAGYTSKCIDDKLIDAKNMKYARFGAYMGGFVLGALTRDKAGVGKIFGPFINEGVAGRVHQFDAQGKLLAYDVEFNAKNCAALSGKLKSVYDGFSASVLTQP